MSTDDQKQALAELKKEATALGVDYSPNIGYDTLLERVEAAKAKDENEDKDADKKASTNGESDKEDSKSEKLDVSSYKKAMQLVRVIVTPRDTAKSDTDGDFFRVSNSVVGTVGKFVAYNNPEGWHIPKILYNVLVGKKMRITVSKKNDKGELVVSSKQLPAYNVQVLPDLTPEELKKLADDQRARSAISDS